MSNPKRSPHWSYAELTVALERDIEWHRSYVIEHPAARRTVADRADGAFGLWHSITMGWQNDGDKDRLKAMIDQIREA